MVNDFFSSFPLSLGEGWGGGLLKQGCTTGNAEGCEGGNNGLNNGVEDGYPGRFFLGFGHGEN